MTELTQYDHERARIAEAVRHGKLTLIEGERRSGDIDRAEERALLKDARESAGRLIAFKAALAMKRAKTKEQRLQAKAREKVLRQACRSLRRYEART